MGTFDSVKKDLQVDNAVHLSDYCRISRHVVHHRKHAPFPADGGCRGRPADQAGMFRHVPLVAISVDPLEEQPRLVTASQLTLLPNHHARFFLTRPSSPCGSIVERFDYF